MTTGFESATDWQLRRLYNTLLAKWQYYMVNSYRLLAQAMEPEMKLVNDEIQRRAEIRKGPH